MFRVTLSPSRVADFKTCPQLYKYRAVDRLPEPTDPGAARGSLVHAVLQQLLLLPPDERTLTRALEISMLIWKEIAASPEAKELKVAVDLAEWLAEGERMLRNFFLLEDPSSADPHELEWWVEHEGRNVDLRGVIDRVDVLPNGDWVLTDYKTGPSPSDNFALGSFFGLKFYALMCWRTFERLPKELRLVHLKEPVVFTLVPTPKMLEGLEKQLEAVGFAVARALASGDFRPRKGHQCNWCPHRAICPAWAESIEPTKAPISAAGADGAA